MMTLEDILSSLNVTMPSVTANATERLSVTPTGYGSSDELQSFLDNQQDNINQGLGNSGFGPTGAGGNFNWNSAISNGLSALTGGIGILNTATQAAQINENNGFQDRIADLNTLGRAGYADYDQVLSAYQNAGAPMRQNYNDVRGMTNGQKWGAVGSGALQGASAGLAFGPWGAAIGGVLGAAGAGLGVLSGNTKARVQTDFDNLQSDLAQSNFRTNMQAATERIADQKNRQGQVHFVAEGGNIERRQMDIREFASKVLNKKDYIDRPVRKMVKGGVMIRYKVK